MYSENEIYLAKLAASKAVEAGGKITFEEYDKAMHGERYWPPFNWAVGWGLPYPAKKSNMDKMCAFVACEIGLINQGDGFYEVAK